MWPIYSEHNSFKTHCEKNLKWFLKLFEASGLSKKIREYIFQRVEQYLSLPYYSYYLQQDQ